MTTLREQIQVKRPIEEAFAYVTDFTTTQEWDSTAIRAHKLTPGKIGVGTCFEVLCKAGPTSIKLVYEITELEQNRKVVLSGSSRLFDIRDTITFNENKGGVSITYQAEFLFNRVMGCLSKYLQSQLEAMGKDSMRGLKSALEDQNSTPQKGDEPGLKERMVLSTTA